MATEKKKSISFRKTLVGLDKDSHLMGNFIMALGMTTDPLPLVGFIQEVPPGSCHQGGNDFKGRQNPIQQAPR